MAKRKTRSSAINMVFLNIPEASATVEVHLTTGSLHHTIGIEIPNREPAQATHGQVKVTTPDEIEAFGDHVGKAEILQNSARACGRECKDAHDDLRITRRIYGEPKRRGSAKGQT
ncbi:hypothetical protein BBAD15_g2644 [Beauveria bassiana D1-5]|uniref:Uncharacterized protein n=1 Tax=Beauveria bassiana D1-5 TaxID=1245745 RepID=A0A0A2VZ55_BEABA|nr:hypothetical protein BBAD15_g2644 [Beauveria bassiana D1-5]